MHLSSLRVSNFRCFGEPGLVFEFTPGINVIIGENNVGKSALADALRILFSLGPGRREIFVTPQDFHFLENGDQAVEMTLDAEFADLSEDEQGAFYEILVMSDPPVARIHLRFRRETVNGQPRVRQTVWGGELEGQPVGNATHELISHVFLDALRDAESDLRPGRGSRLGQLVRRMIREQADRDRILQFANEANQRILRERGVQLAAATINGHLEDLAGPSLRQVVRIGFTPPVFDRVVETLRPLLPHAGRHSFFAVYDEPDWASLCAEGGGSRSVMERCAAHHDGRVTVDLGAISPEEQAALPEPVSASLSEHVQIAFGLEQNGLGYNNLIYMGVVLGDLVERRRAEPYCYNTLIIEEPEAHLHPQLQVLVYDFLDRTSRVHPGEARVQVFVTSHSPTLASRADLDSLVVVHRNATGTIVATPIRRCPLTPGEKLDLRRYLDVTRSQLLFARAVLLVEGISEAMLMPVLARRVDRRLDHGAVEVVPVSGVAFAPFAKLFNSGDPATSLDVPCAILTDDDRCSDRGDEFRLSDDDSPAERVRKLRAGSASARCSSTNRLAGGRLQVFVARKTLEFELGRRAENLPVLADAVRQSGHPFIGRDLQHETSTAPDEWARAAITWSKLVGIKAEVAQRLASLLEQQAGDGPAYDFEVPDYIQEALTHVTAAAVPTVGEP